MPISPATSAALNRPLRTFEQAQADIEHARLKHRWKIEGWKECQECEGTGRVMHCPRLDGPDVEVSCIECDGHGGRMMDFEEWLEEQGIEI